MPEIRLFINGEAVTAGPDTSVAAAILNQGVTAFRTSVTGQPRAAMCGMGICYECRVTIDGNPHVRSCQVLCRTGMRVVTG